MKNRFRKKGPHLQRQKTIFQQYHFFQLLFCVIMFSSIDSLFFSKTTYYSGCYSEAYSEMIISSMMGERSSGGSLH